MAVYLSKLVINTDNPTGLRSLIDPYEAHRTIWRGFPNKDEGGPGRVLFRLEYRRTFPRLVALVQSHMEPDWQPLINNRILLSENCIVYSEKLEQLTKSGQQLRFRLRANPTKKIKTPKEGGLKPVRVDLRGDEQQMDWLRRKSKNGGFRLVECRISAKDKRESSKAGNKDKITHVGVVFEGILEVSDTVAFTRTLESGIGSAKGFGFGLLSIAPVR